MKYIVRIIGEGFETVCDTLEEAEAEAKRIIDKVPWQKENIYIDEVVADINTGAYYKYDPETKTYKRHML